MKIFQHCEALDQWECFKYLAWQRDDTAEESPGQRRHQVTHGRHGPCTNGRLHTIYLGKSGLLPSPAPFLLDDVKNAIKRPRVSLQVWSAKFRSPHLYGLIQAISEVNQINPSLTPIRVTLLGSTLGNWKLPLLLLDVHFGGWTL